MRKVSLNSPNQQPHPSIHFEEEKTDLGHSFVDMSTIGPASSNVDELIQGLSRPPTKIVVPLEEEPPALAPTVATVTPPTAVVAQTATPPVSQPDTPVQTQSWDFFSALWWLIKKAFCCGS